jgi:hypothetical protein
MHPATRSLPDERDSLLFLRLSVALLFSVVCYPAQIQCILGAFSSINEIWCRQLDAYCGCQLMKVGSAGDVISAIFLDFKFFEPGRRRNFYSRISAWGNLTGTAATAAAAPCFGAKTITVQTTEHEDERILEQKQLPPS